jgi:hypothetical protein
METKRKVYRLCCMHAYTQSLKGSFEAGLSACKSNVNTHLEMTRYLLKVPKCDIFHRLDFHDFYSFYTIKPFWVGDFGDKI